MRLLPSQEAALQEVISGLRQSLRNHIDPPKRSSALNDGDFSKYYLLGCSVFHKVIKLSEKETIKPTSEGENWSTGWVYAYGEITINEGES